MTRVRSTGLAAGLPVGWIVAAALATAACAPTMVDDTDGGRPLLAPVGFDALPGWGDDRVAEAIPALRRSCARLMSLPAERPMTAGGPVGDWRAPCAALAAADPHTDAAARSFLETWFVPHRVTGTDAVAEGLFTGYYEPELRGSWRPDDRYRVPLLARPDDLVSVDLGQFRADLKGTRIAGRVESGRLVPYADRAAIDGGALGGRGLEVLWVDDPADAFFLHVQGSGRVRMTDGSVVRVGYDGQNGHPYVSVGKLLIERGEVDRDAMSLQAIRAWLAKHPERAAALLAENPSYVFFRVTAAADGEGPVGAQGVPLTPGRSLAVDSRYVPYGAPVWLDTTDPREPGRPLRRLVVAQDTGGAIKGVVRGDLFWGAGSEAAEAAGRMKERGRYYLMLPRPAGS